MTEHLNSITAYFECELLHARAFTSFINGDYLELYLSTMTLGGSTPKLVIGKQSARAIATGLKFLTPNLVWQTPSDMMVKQSLFPQTPFVPTDEELVLYLYNGGLLTQYISHGEHIATIRRLG